jgi:hypothetical protein
MSRFYSIIDSPSITSINERLALSSMASTLEKGRVIVEVGTEQGGSAKIITDSTQADLYSIDIEDKINATMVDRTRFKFCLGDAKAFKKAHPDLEIDFLFIDADHSFGGVKEDFDTLYPMLKPGGLVAFHDVDRTHLGVLVFVETLRHNNIISDCLRLDSLVIARKKGQIRHLEADKFVETIASLALNYKGDESEDAVRVNASGPSSYFIGRGFLGRVGSLLLGMDISKFINSSEASDRLGTYYVFSSFFSEIKDHLMMAKMIMRENIHQMNDKTLSCLAWDDIVNHQGKNILKLATSNLEREILTRCFIEDSRKIGGIMLQTGFTGCFLRSFFNSF